MNNDNNGEWWNRQCQSSTLEGDNVTAEIPKNVMNSTNQLDDHLNYMFDDTTTPLKACADLHYHVTGNELCGKEEEQYRGESYSHAKRRRVLHFEPEFLDSSLCNDDIFLRSKEKMDCVEDAISEMTEWVAGFAESSDASGDEHLDPSSEGWIANCFNDNDLQFCAKDLNASEGSDVQIDISEFCDDSPDNDANDVDMLPVHTNQNVVFKGRKSYMQTPPPKMASSIIYPFSFIKPCGARGDVTLDDINQWLVNPKPNKNEEDPSLSFPTSAFSGKPVVGKTKIRTEGGEGSITIVRTKG